MKKIVLNRAVFIVLTVIIYGCIAKPKGNYKYYKDFNCYLKTEQNIRTDTLKEYFFYAIAIDEGCECTYLNLTFAKDSLESIKNRLSLILVGDKSEDRTNRLIDSLVTKGFKIIPDKENKLFSYSLGFGKPIFIHYKKGKEQYGQTVYDSEIDLIKAYLNTCDL